MITEISRKQIVRDVAERTGFAQKYVRCFFTCLGEQIVEYMNQANPYGKENKIKFTFIDGIEMGAYRMPERMGVDPRDQSQLLLKERVIPYCKFTQSFKRSVTYPEKVPTEEDKIFEYMADAGYFGDVKEIYDE